MSDESHNGSSPANLEQFIRSIPHDAHATPEAGATETTAQAIHTLLHFTLGEHHYAIGGEHIREVIQPEGITRLPGAPPHIRGVVVHRRSVIGVLDLERWLQLGQTSSPNEERLILVEHGDLIAGLCTDSFTRILTIEERAMQHALNSAPDPQSAPYIRAIIEREDAPPILLLHITRLLGDAAVRH